MKPYIVLDKKVGETPLECMEKWRMAETTDAYRGIPLAYAGRLDPMASGKLLVLIGDECKVQEKYHGLDKEYAFEVLFGVSSDSGDVLGLVSACDVPPFSKQAIGDVARQLIGEIELPYPQFSSKTVNGKPLHTWKLEGRIGEIEIPTKKSTIYELKLQNMHVLSAEAVYAQATRKIETIPKVTDERKALGKDFRRSDVRASWSDFLNTNKNKQFTIATFSCIASSGTYMRTLAEVIAKDLQTCGLAFSIDRTQIGTYKKVFNTIGRWTKKF